ncbi:MAG: nucleotidyltransferase domain-containing protein [Treponema sp.]|nr:nucleotidyltransferase domain-containing protein [Treponema sp.]
MKNSYIQCTKQRVCFVQFPDSPGTIIGNCPHRHKRRFGLPVKQYALTRPLPKNRRRFFLERLTIKIVLSILVHMVSTVPFLDQIVSLIVSMASPDQIILFGSYARGDNTEKSDVDLLIVKKGLKNGREITGNLYIALSYSDIDIPVDLLIIDSDRYEALKNEIGLVYKTIHKEGKVIYGTA